MIKGSTIIYNDEFINELTKYRDMCKEELVRESNMDKKVEIQERLNYFEAKLVSAIEFNDIIEEVINLNIPRLTAVKTVGGLVIPTNNIQII